MNSYIRALATSFTCRLVLVGSSGVCRLACDEVFTKCPPSVEITLKAF